MLATSAGKAKSKKLEESWEGAVWSGFNSFGHALRAHRIREHKIFKEYNREKWENLSYIYRDEGVI